MKRPHCLVAFHDNWQLVEICKEPSKTGMPPSWKSLWQICPSCEKAIIFLQRYEEVLARTSITKNFLVNPKAQARRLPPEVPDSYRRDFDEACLVVPDSPKASAAISRRCLQNLLREKANVNPSDLSKEIDEVVASKTLPTHLAEAIDAIRNVGNFAAHPLKSQNTGAIMEVEPGEAEWLLDVLEGLFDFYFVQPAILAKKRQALNQKLQEAGKPPMK